MIQIEDRATCLFGDGRKCCIIRSRKWKRIISSWLMSDGSGSSVIEIPAGGGNHTIQRIFQGEQFFHMDGRAVWDFAIEAFPHSK